MFQAKVIWAKTIRNLGTFHDEPSLYLPITVLCTMGTPECGVVVAGPSTPLTNIDSLPIDMWPHHQYFLASINSEGKPMWIKELFADTKFGEIRGFLQFLS